MQNYVLVSAAQCEGKETAYKGIADRPEDNIEVNLKINIVNTGVLYYRQTQQTFNIIIHKCYVFRPLRQGPKHVAFIDIIKRVSLIVIYTPILVSQ
jgi:hypothetical protein